MAQSASDLETEKLNRVAKRMQCNCGCNMDMSCQMQPYMCGTCKRFKTQIYKLQKEGKSDDAVVNQVVADEKKNLQAQIDALRKSGVRDDLVIAQIGEASGKFKARLDALGKSGKPADQVLAQFVEQTGDELIASHPGPIGAILSYTGLGLGLLLILFFFRRYRKAPAAEHVDPAVLGRYQDQIEKETSKFD